MAAKLRLPAPAKLNLMLHITGCREDGYHLLQSVFQFIDLCDWLEFETEAGGAIRRLDSTTPVAAEDDILLVAARLLQARFQVSQGVGPLKCTYTIHIGCHDWNSAIVFVAIGLVVAKGKFTLQFHIFAATEGAAFGTD